MEEIKTTQEKRLNTKEIDEALIEVLNRTAHVATVTDLSSKTGISPTTIRHRLMRFDFRDKVSADFDIQKKENRLMVFRK